MKWWWSPMKRDAAILDGLNRALGSQNRRNETVHQDLANLAEAVNVNAATLRLVRDHLGKALERITFLEQMLAAPK
jgi:ABC-type transporter Mla subunit MlaD